VETNDKNITLSGSPLGHVKLNSAKVRCRRNTHPGD